VPSHPTTTAGVNMEGVDLSRLSHPRSLPPPAQFAVAAPERRFSEVGSSACTESPLVLPCSAKEGRRGVRGLAEHARIGERVRRRLTFPSKRDRSSVKPP
jgi:hypothetical protein